MMKSRRVLPKFCGYFTDARGKQRLRFRKKGRKTVYPSAEPGSEDFLAEYRAFVGNSSTESRPRLASGSIAAVVMHYCRSTEFQALSKVTQGNYRGILDRFAKAHGAKSIKSIGTVHVNALIDEKAGTTAAAKLFRLRLKALMDFAVGAGYRTDNPVLGAKKVKHRYKGIRPWTEQDIADFRSRWSLQSPQRIAVEVLLHTGLRRSDAVRLGRQHLRQTPAGERLVIKTKKSREMVELSIPIHPTLKSVLNSLPREQMLYLATKGGAPRSEKAFTNWIREAAHDAGLPSNSSPHGLRKAACRRLADAGCDAFQIQSITGHQNLEEVQVYVRDRDKALLSTAAMDNYAKSFPHQG